MVGAALIVLAVVAASACELVLGQLPPVATVGSPDGGGGSSASTTSSAASSGGGACCDCDGDGYNAEGTCGGLDCDDTDKSVYPGETAYYDTPANNGSFDYDCSGTLERDPTLDVTVSCATLALPCASTDGYLGATPPECGVAAAWGSCKQQGITCVDDVIGMIKMKCR